MNKKPEAATELSCEELDQIGVAGGEHILLGRSVDVPKTSAAGTDFIKLAKEVPER